MLAQMPASGTTSPLQPSSLADLAALHHSTRDPTAAAAVQQRYLGFGQR